MSVLRLDMQLKLWNSWGYVFKVVKVYLVSIFQLKTIQDVPRRKTIGNLQIEKFWKCVNVVKSAWSIRLKYFLFGTVSIVELGTNLFDFKCNTLYIYYIFKYYWWFPAFFQVSYVLLMCQASTISFVSSTCRR